MKYVIYIGIVIAFVLGLFNATRIDMQHPFQGESSVALIGLVACGCAILILLILKMSKRIAEKVKERS
ncbi:MAG: NADH:ubiquinone oxidoreductase subunit 6 (subunit J) [Flavobacteriales bacterium]|jgi:NADH:ubiquinone oxidoreductase subunit 6 (subunit J)